MKFIRIDDNIMKALSEQAQRNRRSLTMELRVILEKELLIAPDPYMISKSDPKSPNPDNG